MLRASEQRIAGSVIELLARHRRELGVAANATAAQDCLVIARALVDAEALVSTQPRANLNKRVERALLGYLTAVSGRSPPAPRPTAPRA